MAVSRGRRVVQLIVLAMVGVTIVSCRAGDGVIAAPQDSVRPEGIVKAQGPAAFASNRGGKELVEVAATRKIASELRSNRQRWFRGVTMKSNPRAYCAGLVSLIATYMPGPAGVVVSSDWKAERAREIVQAHPRCAPANTMSVFGETTVDHAVSVGRAFATLIDTLPDGQDADAWANATFTESWADGVSNETVSATDVDATVISVGNSLGGEKFEIYQSSIFASYDDCGLVCSMKAAFVGGCIAGGRSMVGYAIAQGKNAAIVAGPTAGIALGVGLVATGCVTEGTIFALVVYDLWGDE